MAEFKVRAIPNAKKAGIVGFENGSLKIKVNAPPDKGRANKEIIEILAKKLKVKKSAIRIIKGETCRDKVLEIHGVDEKQLINVADRD